MKKLINTIALKIVNSDKELQESVVLEYAKGREIATYSVKDSDVTIENVVMLNSMITGCTLKNSTNNVFKITCLNSNNNGTVHYK